MILSTITTDNYKRHQREVILSPKAKWTNDSDRCLCTPSELTNATPQVLRNYNKTIHALFDVLPPHGSAIEFPTTSPEANTTIPQPTNHWRGPLIPRFTTSVSVVSSISRCFRAMSTMHAQRVVIIRNLAVSEILGRPTVVQESVTKMRPYEINIYNSFIRPKRDRTIPFKVHFCKCFAANDIRPRMAGKSSHKRGKTQARIFWLLVLCVSRRLRACLPL